MLLNFLLVLSHMTIWLWIILVVICFVLLRIWSFLIATCVEDRTLHSGNSGTGTLKLYEVLVEAKHLD